MASPEPKVAVLAITNDFFETDVDEDDVRYYHPTAMECSPVSIHPITCSLCARGSRILVAFRQLDIRPRCRNVFMLQEHFGKQYFLGDYSDQEIIWLKISRLANLVLGKFADVHFMIDSKNCLWKLRSHMTRLFCYFPVQIFRWQSCFVCS